MIIKYKVRDLQISQLGLVNFVSRDVILENFILHRGAASAKDIATVLSNEMVYKMASY